MSPSFQACLQIQLSWKDRSISVLLKQWGESGMRSHWLKCSGVITAGPDTFLQGMIYSCNSLWLFIMSII